MEVSIPLGAIIELASKLVKVSAISASSTKITERLRKAACQFQLEYTNYYFSSSRLHKIFKESKEDTKEVAYQNMDSLLLNGMKKNIGDIASQIQNYFVETHPSAISPRVGIHLLTEDEILMDIIEIPSVKGGGTKKKISSFTALNEVVKSGRPYLVNDIPRHIKNTYDYKHSGFNINKIKEKYVLKFNDKKVISRWKNNLRFDLKKDSEWCEMAVGDSKKYSSLYKSHMVIPITYRRHAEKAGLSEEMINVLKLDDGGRSILGFLFVDHPSTYYFSDIEPLNYNNCDANALVIFADMISLVLVTRLMYTVGSTTVESYKNNSGV